VARFDVTERFDMREKIVSLRSYKECFARPKVKLISQLIDELEDLTDPQTGYKVYTSEIQRCLSVGLLLAALSVSTSLLELFLRDLAVAYRILSCHEGDMELKHRVEREFEEDRQKTFDSILKDIELTVITPEDSEALRKFYRDTRIPLAHALIRRLSGGVFDVPELDDLFASLSRHTKLEERFEDAALADIKFTVRMLKKYRPWLLRRYCSNS
jgi:hypothetical protein